MTSIDTTSTMIQTPDRGYAGDPAQLAAAAFLARYSGRTLDAYRHDLRDYFQWAGGVGLNVLDATRPHIELYRGWLDECGLAASTIDRRLSTVWGFYRFAHIDGPVASNPAQYVRRPQVHPSEGRGLDRSELGRFLFATERYDHDLAALAVLLGLNGLRVSEACATNVEDLGVDRGHRTLRIVGKGNKPAVVPLVPRTARTIDWPSVRAATVRSCGAATVNAPIAAPHTAGSIRSGSVPGLDWSTLTCCERRSSWPRSTRAFRCGTCRSLPATRILAPPRSTTGAARTSIATPLMSS